MPFWQSFGGNCKTARSPTNGSSGCERYRNDIEGFSGMDKGDQKRL
jgi:hypothetical protein